MLLLRFPNGLIRSMSGRWLSEEATETIVHPLVEPLTVPVKRGADKYSLLKKRAAHIRWKGINFADKYLIEFESNFSRRGGKVHWVLNEKELTDALKAMAKKERLNMNASLFLADDPTPFHKLNKDENGRQAWLIKADYLMADPGGIVYYLPEGFRLPDGDDCILIASVDRVLPSLASLETMIRLRSVLKPDDATPAHLLFGSHPAGGSVHVFITENKATEMMAVKTHRSLLHCIDCNRCAMHPSETRMSDEIRKQALDRSGEFLTDSFSFPLDGQHSSVCPVNINFERLILLNRQSSVNRNFVPSSEKWFYFFWTKAAARKSKIPVPGRSMDYYVNSIFIKSESKLREPLQPAAKSFSRLWKEYSGLN